MTTLPPVRRRSSTLTQRYAAGLVLDAWKLAFIVLAGAEAIFLSDALISNLLPVALEHQAGILNLLTLVVLSVPVVLVIALPLALLVGAYFAFLRRRQVAEFTVIAGMGYSSRSLIALAVAIGLGGLAASLLLSGFAEPLARHQLAEAVFHIQYDALREGKIAAGKFYRIGNYAVFASSGRLNDAANNIFIHQRVSPQKDRVVVARHAVRFRGPERSTNIGLILEGVAIFDLQHPELDSDEGGPASHDDQCAGCLDTATVSPFQIMRFDRIFVEFPSANLPSLGPRSSQPQEWTSLELLQQGPREEWVTSILGDRMLRGLICFLTPLIGLLAVAMTTDRTYLLALPVAGSVVLCAGFFGSYGVEFLAARGLLATVGVLIALAASAAVFVAAWIRRRESGYIRPLGVWV